MDSANRIGLQFILIGLLALAGSVLFGAIGAFTFLYPEFLEALPFHKIRPLHVSLAVSWIFLVTGLAILGSYLLGKFGRREYWAFPPILSVPIFFSWILFGVNYFKTVAKHKTAWPVYDWMWGTGIVFFFLTFSEAHLWLFSFFRENMVREVTVQWKAYGALFGSWNMLVYGTAIFVMEKISGDTAISRSKLAFSLYFLGLFNLMFGWAHHAYPVPLELWIRNFAYIVSMSELLILGKIIWDWRRSLSGYQKYRHRCAYRFMFAADLWVFLNLVLALIMSVPAANLITHGTHITVAHAMGTTIGINTMILLASVFYVIEEQVGLEFGRRHAVAIRTGFWLANGSLVIFLTALVAAGLVRATYTAGSFQEMMETISPYLLVFAGSGIGLMLGLWMISLPALHLIYRLAFPSRQLVAIGALQRD